VRLNKYSVEGRGEADWTFSPVELQDFNLLVGDSASGKTRFLSTIFNIGTFVAQDDFKTGYWDLEFTQGERKYGWVIETRAGSQDEASQRVVKETLVEHLPNSTRTVVSRTEHSFLYNGDSLPKLSPRSTSLWLLRDEDEIRPLYNGFESIQRRSFYGSALEDVTKLESVPPELTRTEENAPSLDTIYQSQLGLNARLALLSLHYAELFASIRLHFRAAFHFVEEAEVRSLKEVAPQLRLPLDVKVFCIREKGSAQWLPIYELSSGMQKVLLVLTDLAITPEDSIYLIDEYENSLGISAITFVPDFLITFEKRVQLFVTSHHPYLINNVPVSNWYLFTRKGRHVSIKFGQELVQRFGKSRQQAFIQLINDPLYSTPA
jgi:hypothetical protein